MALNRKISGQTFEIVVVGWRSKSGALSRQTSAATFGHTSQTSPTRETSAPVLINSLPLLIANACAALARRRAASREATDYCIRPRIAEPITTVDAGNDHAVRHPQSLQHGWLRKAKHPDASDHPVPQSASNRSPASKVETFRDGFWRRTRLQESHRPDPFVPSRVLCQSADCLLDFLLNLIIGKASSILDTDVPPDNIVITIGKKTT